MPRLLPMAPTLSSRPHATLRAVFVLAPIVFQATLRGRPASLLGVALGVAYVLWIGDSWSVGDPGLGITYAIGLVVFLAHATEEYVTGFHLRLPSIMGIPPWTDAQFLTFNVVWFAVFVTGLLVYRRHALGALVILFFAVGGGVVNGLGHIFVTITEFQYFPGTWTAPLCAVIGVLLLWRMFRNPLPSGTQREQE